jgi:hypothetical protein
MGAGTEAGETPLPLSVKSVVAVMLGPGPPWQGKGRMHVLATGVKVKVAGPEAVGEKVKDKVQVSVWRVLPGKKQLSLVLLNGAATELKLLPMISRLEFVVVAVNVALSAEDVVPTVVSGKTRVVGENVIESASDGV